MEAVFVIFFLAALHFFSQAIENRIEMFLFPTTIGIYDHVSTGYVVMIKTKGLLDR